jgi:hypothetical protein
MLKPQLLYLNISNFEMLKAHLLLIMFICGACQVLGQKVIEGKVLEVHSNTPISYVNIGIVNSAVGTISNEDGTFVINITEAHLSDTITFSALGYVRKSIPVRLFHENGGIRIFLKPRETILKEVTVLSKRLDPAEFDLGAFALGIGLILAPATFEIYKRQPINR